MKTTETIINRVKNIKNNIFEVDLKSNIKLLENSIKGKNILVIGGAGTIGSNYIKEMLRFLPNSIIVVDVNENGLAELVRELRSSSLLDYNPTFITYPLDINSQTFDKIFEQYHFDIVSNFAAHKHVRSEKDLISIEALIKNNVLGAIKILNLCEQYGIKTFFSVSTDKATNPVNIMGASKAFMEKLILSKKNSLNVKTARFANVAFSNGSLLDGFINRIEKQQPLSCPEDIRRFFVSPQQSGQICLLSTFLGESGYVFFPKLDFNTEQYFFKDLAFDFLEANGFQPVITKSEEEAKSFDFLANQNQYPIYLFKSDTSGEKEYEEFYSEEDVYFIDRYSSLGYLIGEDENLDFNKIKEDIDSLFNKSDLEKSDVLSLIGKYVHSFTYKEAGKNLDQKM
jgi:FlaA1/EpsC-like NDP-sugar epimerase